MTRVINPKANQSSIGRTVVLHHGFTQNTISPLLSLCIYVSPQIPPTNSTPTSSDDSASDNGTQGNSFNLSNPINSSSSQERSCLVYYLSNNNYDVFLLDARGSTPMSSKHVNESISSEDYWNFDVHDQAINDVPAQIAKVKEISGRDKVAYIGYSQSTSFMFVLLSVNPQFATENLSAFIAVAPIVFLEHVGGFYPISFPLTNALPGFITNNLNRPFAFSYGTTQVFNDAVKNLCNLTAIADTFCRSLVNILFGPDEFNNVLVSSYDCLLSVSLEI